MAYSSTKVYSFLWFYGQDFNKLFLKTLLWYNIRKIVWKILYIMHLPLFNVIPGINYFLTFPSPSCDISVDGSLIILISRLRHNHLMLLSFLFKLFPTSLMWYILGQRLIYLRIQWIVEFFPIYGCLEKCVPSDGRKWNEHILLSVCSMTVICSYRIYCDHYVSVTVKFRIGYTKITFKL